MKSWRTTIWGAIALAAGCIITADFGPHVTKVAGCVASIATGIGLLFARDNKVTSEEAGANPRVIPDREQIQL